MQMEILLHLLPINSEKNMKSVKKINETTAATKKKKILAPGGKKKRFLNQ
jgi:hypothetical protein